MGYLEGAKLQFELRQFALEDGPQQRLLHTALPRSLYRLSRRDAMRVRPADVGAPTVRFRHPLAPERWTQVRAIDVGAAGCALWRPIDAMPLPPGMALLQAEVELDERTFFYADLTIRHVTLGTPDSGGRTAGMRVGCRWDGLAPPAVAALGQWLRSGQGRRQRIALSFDDSKA